MKAIILVLALSLMGGTTFAQDEAPSCITQSYIAEKNPGAMFVSLNPEQFAILKSLEQDKGFPDTAVIGEIASTQKTVEAEKVVIFVFDKDGCLIGAVSRGVEFLKQIIGAAG